MMPLIRQPGPRDTPAGPIRIDEAYDKKEFLRRVGFKQGAFHSCVRAGLKTCQAGGRVFVLGSDWIEFLSRSRPD